MPLMDTSTAQEESLDKELKKRGIDLSPEDVKQAAIHWSILAGMAEKLCNVSQGPAYSTSEESDVG